MIGIKITGKVKDEDGFPMPGAVIREIPLEGYTGAADVYTDGIGAFTMQVMNQNSTIEVSAEGYETLLFPAKSVPAIISMAFEGIIIEVDANKKKDKTLLYLGIGAGVLVLIALARGKTKPQASTPAKKQIKPKVVEV